MPTASNIDLIVVAAYLIAVTLLGCLMSRRTHSSSEFIAAGGSLPGWVVGLSIIGTFVSSISFIANPGKSYAGTWVPFVFALSLPYAALVATVYFVPFFRNSGSLSAYEHLGDRFGIWARIYAAVFNILYHIGRIAVILYGVSLAVAALIDIRIEIIILVLGLLVIAYTLMGGIEAVIWTDVIQSIILIGGMLVCLYLLVAGVPGGIRGILEGAQTEQTNKLSLGSLRLSFASETFWTVLVFGFFINLQNFAADQTFVQRYFTARSEGDARRSVWLGAIAYIPISAILFFIGTGLYVFYQSNGDLPPDLQTDKILPFFIVSELPVGLAGLLIAAILAAAMSTVDSSLNSSATLLLCDIRTPFFSQQETSPDGSVIRDDKAELRFLRLMTIALGLVGMGAAFALINSDGMLDIWWKTSGVLSGGTLGLILLARFTNAKGTRGPAIGVTLGVVAIAVVTLAHLEATPKWFSGFRPLLDPIRTNCHPLMAIVVGTIVVFAAGLIFSDRKSQQEST